MFDSSYAQANDFLAFVQEQRSLLKDARKGSSEAREKLCSVVYVIACIEMDVGASRDQIREQLLEQSSETIGADTIDRERRAAEVAEAIEAALDGRPPRYPKWLNLAALEDLGSQGGPAA